MYVLYYCSVCNIGAIFGATVSVCTCCRINGLGLPNRAGVEVAIDDTGLIADGSVSQDFCCRSSAYSTFAAENTRLITRDYLTICRSSSRGSNSKDHHDCQDHRRNTLFHSNTLPFFCPIDLFFTTEIKSIILTGFRYRLLKSPHRHHPFCRNIRWGESAISTPHTVTASTPLYVHKNKELTHLAKNGRTAIAQKRQLFYYF